MNRIKLQVALDFIELPRAMAAAKAAVEGGADYIEAGTPLIKSEGLDAVRRLREAFPRHTIIADLKIMDAGRIETEAAAKAGADVVTVLGAADAATVRECVEAGRHYGCKVAMDLIGAADPLALAAKAGELGVAWLDVHCPIDSQMRGGDPLEMLKRVRPVTRLVLAVAGGINSRTAAAAAEAGADVIIVGGAITKAADPKRATEDIRKAIDTLKPVATEHFNRLGGLLSDDELRAALSRVRTPNVSDGAHRRPCLPDIRPLWPGMCPAACGPAVTVQTVPGDWAKPVEAIDAARPGDVIVIDAGGRPPAVWGELASESAKNKGIAAVVCYGAVRDSADIRRLELPVWTRCVSSHAGDPHGIGGINLPIQIGGLWIMPGDWILADDDGVMAIPKAEAVEMANRAADVLEAENRIRAEIRDGSSTLAKVLNLLRWEKTGGGPAAG